MGRALVLTFAGYACGTVLLVLYGDRVCPVMGACGSARLAIIVASGFTVSMLVTFLDYRHRPDLHPAKRWIVAWYLWAIPAVPLFAMELLSPPMAISAMTALLSAVKLLLGSMTVGFFISCLVSLELEYEWLAAHAEDGRDVKEGLHLSIADRMLGFTVRAFILSGVVVFLIAARDHSTIFVAIQHDYVAQSIAIGIVLLMAFLWRITRQYRRLYGRLYELEHDVLQAVRKGRFDVRVPLVSHDEFRQIAQGTNEMIAGLREREAMRERFGKHFSPEVMEAILRSDRLGGEQKTVTVMFTDLRDYTSLTEQLHADQVIAMLNDYFTLVVDAVYRNRGVLDKFIGDAAMAYFGFTNDEDSVVLAVRTALEIQEGLAVLNRELAAKGQPSLANGIGIHHGPVIAGTIGAPSRREFTIIGDTVNVAARLESLTKLVRCPIILSAAAYERCGELQRYFRERGEHEVKGKTERVTVYGFDKVTSTFRLPDRAKGG